MRMHPTGTPFDKNLATGNSNPGLGLDGASQNLLTGNVARDNGGNGFELLFGASGNTLRGNTSSINDTGLLVQASSGNVVTSNRFLSNAPEWGVFVVDSSDNRFVGNLSQGNAYEGFALVGSTGNQLVSNTSRGSSYEGFALWYGSDGNLLDGNVATGNATSGVGIFQSSHNSITHNVAASNHDGFMLVGSSDNTLTKNQALNSGAPGEGGGFVLFEGSTGNQLTLNTASGNGDVGFLLDASPGNTLQGNLSNNNGNTGIEVKSSSDNNRIQGNTVSGSGGDGIRIADSNANLIQANTSNRNGGIGFHVMLGSVTNTLMKNVGFHNVVLDASDENVPGLNTWKLNLFGRTQFA